FLDEVAFFNAQIALFYVGLAESYVARELLRGSSTLLGRQAVALRQRLGVFCRRPLLHFGAHLTEILEQVRRLLLVVPRGVGVGRQKQDVGKIVPGRELRGFKVQNAGDEHDAVKGDPMFYQVSGESRGARRAVTLTHHEEW